MDELIALERRGWDALSSGAGEAERFYREVLADRALFVLPGGLVLAGRGEILESMGGEPWAGYELSDIRVLEIAGDTAAIAYRAAARRDGHPGYAALCTSTYRRAASSWQLVLHQQTPV
jgi:hypothetical protein